MTTSNVQTDDADPPVVAPAAPSQAARVFSVLTLAFAADPPTRWLFPDAEQYIRCFPRFAQAFAGMAFTRHTAWLSDDGAGAALWLPPDAHPDEDALVALIEENVTGREQADVFAVFEEMGRRHPAEPHWYLPLIGVDPSRQGRGSVRPCSGRCWPNAMRCRRWPISNRPIRATARFMSGTGSRRSGRSGSGGVHRSHRCCGDRKHRVGGRFDADPKSTNPPGTIRHRDTPEVKELAAPAHPRSPTSFYRSSGTIQNGFWPRATRSQLSKALRQRFGWLSQVGPAECGLKMMFFSVNSSWSGASAAPRP